MLLDAMDMLRNMPPDTMQILASPQMQQLLQTLQQLSDMIPNLEDRHVKVRVIQLKSGQILNKMSSLVVGDFDKWHVNLLYHYCKK